jgi:hypothetical protein
MVDSAALAFRKAFCLSHDTPLPPVMHGEFVKFATAVELIGAGRKNHMTEDMLLRLARVARGHFLNRLNAQCWPATGRR